MLGRRFVFLGRQISSRFASNSAFQPKATTLSEFETLKVIPDGNVYEVQLNMPESRNALNPAAWRELTECFGQLNLIPNCRVVVFSGNGKSFCAGIDLKTAFTKIMEVTGDASLDTARKAVNMTEMIRGAQASFTAMENCRKPIICAVHGHCYGAATSLITAADIRFCTADSQMSIKEVDVGLAADVGVLQRIQRVTGNDSLTRELVFTARSFNGMQAKEFGLVSRIFDKKDDMILAAKELAKEIAKKSPVAVQGSKIMMNYARNHSTTDSLEAMVLWNASMLQTEDLMTNALAMQSKKTPEFKDF
uniref:Uncharacterized protein n=1 Tax=Panagrolaimus sp. JU765 TaxID=591449 RepID=A0AC34RAY5_9BILA